ncbi:glutathione S-transferase C-terminal-like protein [Hygrophoropsis aurantiaca]|uniref:Glutathione S-transferase C-terminal-like protein n=1 Tax=Hygrophoropsis aurantiaca TaxID=72124 RepID=A0ACB8AHS2_9AGAM|nr:glutathione S-transferase C-terminal-like protein [Hygrophoropsis aurantiaca]
MPNQLITIYRCKASPYGHKVDLALAEAKIPHRVFEVKLYDKLPEWFTAEVNPAGKVPAIIYGPADDRPENPSQSAVRLAESAVILEFLADLYPESGLLPKDPIARAKVRFLTEVVSSKFATPLITFLKSGCPMEDILKGVETIQDLLPDTPNEFAFGNTYTIADATLIPFIARLPITSKYDITKYLSGEGYQLEAELQKPKYARFMQYSRTMLERPSTKDTYDEEEVLSIWKAKFPRH